jgi:hypothetical protein
VRSRFPGPVESHALDSAFCAQLAQGNGREAGAAQGPSCEPMHAGALRFSLARDARALVWRADKHWRSRLESAHISCGSGGHAADCPLDVIPRLSGENCRRSGG